MRLRIVREVNVHRRSAAALHFQLAQRILAPQTLNQKTTGTYGLDVEVRKEYALLGSPVAPVYLYRSRELRMPTQVAAYRFIRLDASSAFQIMLDSWKKHAKKAELVSTCLPPVLSFCLSCHRAPISLRILKRTGPPRCLLAPPTSRLVQPPLLQVLLVCSPWPLGSASPLPAMMSAQPCLGSAKTCGELLVHCEVRTP